MLLDILLDDLSFTAIFLGIACASYANFAIIVIGALVYLLNDLVLNLRIHFQRRHEIPAISPLEICALMVIGCGLTFFFPDSRLHLFAHVLGWFDALALLASTYGVFEILSSSRRLYVALRREGR